jgi:hypothetical protein
MQKNNNVKQIGLRVYNFYKARCAVYKNQSYHLHLDIIRICCRTKLTSIFSFVLHKYSIC